MTEPVRIPTWAEIQENGYVDMDYASWWQVLDNSEEGQLRPTIWLGGPAEGCMLRPALDGSGVEWRTFCDGGYWNANGLIPWDRLTALCAALLGWRDAYTPVRAAPPEAE